MDFFYIVVLTEKLKNIQREEDDYMSISKIIIIDMVDILIKLNIEKILYDLSEVIIFIQEQ